MLPPAVTVNRNLSDPSKPDDKNRKSSRPQSVIPADKSLVTHLNILAPFLRHLGDAV
jgi:hypothetical protein